MILFSIVYIYSFRLNHSFRLTQIQAVYHFIVIYFLQETLINYCFVQIFSHIIDIFLELSIKQCYSINMRSLALLISDNE